MKASRLENPKGNKDDNSMFYVFLHDIKKGKKKIS